MLSARMCLYTLCIRVDGNSFTLLIVAGSKTVVHCDALIDVLRNIDAKQNETVTTCDQLLHGGVCYKAV
jgi:hypothetical protein